MLQLSTADVARLRTLAAQLREIAESPRMQALRLQWYRHNDCGDPQPMIIIETQDIFGLIDDAQLCCTHPTAREVERRLLRRLFQACEVCDDTVEDACYNIPWRITTQGWRTQSVDQHAADAAGRELARVAKPLLQPPFDLSQLQPSTWQVDRQATLQALEDWQQIFGDLLHVRIHGAYKWTMGTTEDFMRLCGMENFLMLPYDDPDRFHEIMAFLNDELNRYMDYLQAEGLLCHNNGNDYIGSGTYGFTNQLPGPDFDGHIQSRHLWCLMESQESVDMSPKMFGEFIFPYQKQLAQRFGACYYGCCEPVHTRYQYIQQIENLRSVSVSPWCDIDSIAEQAAPHITLSRKPNPALISHTAFDLQPLQQDFRHLLNAAKGRPVELIMKDLHTVNNQPSRCAQWVQAMRQVVDKA